MRLKSGFLLCTVLLLPKVSEAKSMIINTAIRTAQSVVYELPADADRADAVRYVEGIHDKFFSNLQTIDATSLDDSVLKEKLGGDFVLYTTIGSRLFNLATQPLDIKVVGGNLDWNGVSAPVSDLRIILIGKNPYGEGICTVYAAGSNRMLVGINSCFHGPCSYHIFQGDRLLKEGYYSKVFVVREDRIPQAEAVEDVRQFFSTLQRVHPDLLAKVDFKEYIKLKQQTLEGVAGKLDATGKIGVDELAYLLYYAAAFFQDGHTSVQWQFQPNEENTHGKRFPPFLLGYDNGRFVVTGSTDKSMDGLEIVSVNGAPIREFLRPILDRCSGETLVFKTVRFTHNQAFWYSFSGLLASTPALSLVLRNAQGKQSERSVETVSLADFRKLKDKSLEQLQQRFSQGARVQFLDSDRIAYFIYPAFHYNDDEKKKIDGIFQEIKTRKSHDLIIDIRGNGGGTSNIGDFIFTYLHEGEFCSFSKGRARLSEEVLSSVARDWGIPADAEIEGQIVTQRIENESLTKPRAFFTGRTFLLVDNGSFSSAVGFAAMFRDYGIGEILGYETGGVPNSFGDQYSFNLKNSGIPCGVSWKQFFCPKPRPGDDEHGILPDIPMSDKLLRAYQKDDDPVLAFTLDHVKKTRR